MSSYYNSLYLIFAMILPIGIPMYFWGESLWMSFVLCYVGRYIDSLHATWFVNSAAHMFGDRPYSPIMPVEIPWVSLCSYGEGNSY